jgi:uncharacterized protein
MRYLSALMLSGAAALAFAGAGWAQNAPATLSVNGEGVVYAAPDMATVMLGVTTQGDTAAEAMAANNTAVVAVMARLTSAGVEARDMQTSNLSLGPDYSRYDGSAGGVPDTYVAANMLSVRVRALEGLGAILDASITDGANTLNGISFGLDDPRPALDEARKRAVADARLKAELLAEAAGVGLGPIVSVSEGGGFGQPMPMFRQSDAASAVPVAAGEMGMTATVTIVFEIAE